MNPMHPTLSTVTARIAQRSATSRAAYLAHLDAAHQPGPYREGLGCANAAHAYAAMPANDKLVLRQARQPHLGIVSAYNDMLSAHQPYEHYPEAIRIAARNAGAICASVGPSRPTGVQRTTRSASRTAAAGSS